MIRLKCCFLYGLFFLLIFSRCANPVTPEGGPKDVTPPRVSDCDPPMYTTHFHKKEIRITFNEYIQLKDQNSQINISPPNLPHTDIRLRGKSIFLKLADSLKSNTTYTINFGESISDLTENNILHDFTYTFSTGSYIDSLSLSGKVINAFDLVPQKDVVAMLYVDENDTLPLDSLPRHVKPYYLTKTKENGEFTFHNLRTVPFLLFALSDMNGDYIFDLPNERVAFCDSLVRGTYVVKQETVKKDTALKGDSLLVKKDTLPGKKDSVKKERPTGPAFKLLMFEQTDSVQRVLKADMVGESQVGVFYRFPVVRPEFIPLNLPVTSAWMTPEYNPAKDSVYLWLKNIDQDSLMLRLVDKGKTLDTARIDLRKKNPKKRKGDKKSTLSPLAISTNLRDGRLNQYKGDPVLTLSYPSTKQDLSRILLVDGRDTVKPKVTFADSVRRKLRISYKWKEDGNYRLIVPDSIFHSVNGLSNDSLILSFKAHALRDFGSIQMTVEIKNPSGDYLIQLLDEKENLQEQKTLSSSGKVKFEYLSPGKYKIKAIFDRNRNGRWDTGNFSRKIQPENVSYFQKIIEVRANWDIDESWEP